MNTESLPDAQERAPWARTEDPLRREQGGPGLVITPVGQQVDTQGGRAESASGGVAHTSECVDRRQAALEPPTQPEGAPGGGARVAPAARRILVADDNRDAADSLTMLLEMLGHGVKTAYDGRQALEIAEEYCPDVALLDIGMPEMNGYEVARHLRGRPGTQSAFLVAMTGWGQDSDRQRSKEAGFDHHLVKPVDPKALVALLSPGAPPRQGA